ncbi:MAG: hypothetical protein ABFD44_11475 [Anaerolineaceae bacterium]
MNAQNRAWVLGMCETGLTAMRSLGRAGIPVTGVDWNPDEPGRYSRFGVFERSPSPSDDPQALLEWLIQMGKQNPASGILLPATDAYTAFVSRNRDALAPYFLFALPPAPIMDALLDKYLHVRLAEEMGEKTPFTLLIDENIDLLGASRQLRYPAYIKARYTHLWKQVYTHKGFQVNTPEEFIQICEQIIRNNLSAIAQDIIAAPITNHYEVNFYRSVQVGHPILAILQVRKIRQYPPGLGCGSLVETYENPTVLERTLRFAEKIDFQGIGNIEYIYDEVTHEYYLVELNARLWQQNAQADYCGINFPLIAYRDLQGETQPARLQTIPRVKWLDIISDYRSFRELHKSKKLGTLAWLKSLKGVKVMATFAWDDWMPTLHVLAHGLRYLWSRSVRSASRQ